MVQGAILNFIYKYTWFLGALCTCEEWTNRHPADTVKLIHTPLATEESTVLNNTPYRHATDHIKT